MNPQTRRTAEEIAKEICRNHELTSTTKSAEPACYNCQLIEVNLKSFALQAREEERAACEKLALSEEFMEMDEAVCFAIRDAIRQRGGKVE